MTDAVKARIDAELSAIESKYKVRVLMAVESGSRAWGFASKDSDYDVRFLYMREPEWYLSPFVESKRDVIELPIEDELDINGWDLRKAVKLMAKSNPALLEWFSSDIVYREEEGFRATFAPLLAAYYSPRAGFYHYLHMAKGNFREYLKSDLVKTKKYFYVLRPILCMRWIESHSSIPPLFFETLVDKTVEDTELTNAIAELLVRKKAGFETDYDRPIPVISAFLKAELARLSDCAAAIAVNRKSTDDLARSFVRYVGNA
ncbi:nucleotidyltransferase domain-containing protein [Alteromonas sp. ASW11-36]|uniref:Nucleotidyltransferase domain-containing protein n=1 Tax=Alteromonas arenosi TaxID=3055817 RepID=A0ABT7SWF7_9ALTE|nr:nucleotidyltransferase domain-containing protein [Alteromonas sp. ASW11-36]MDM7860527.1 nucleotidyltransferase domain-containing protein [Alteromonas sp. ASW11-36]